MVRANPNPNLLKWVYYIIVHTFSCPKIILYDNFKRFQTIFTYNNNQNAFSGPKITKIHPSYPKS